MRTTLLSWVAFFLLVTTAVGQEIRINEIGGQPPNGTVPVGTFAEVRGSVSNQDIKSVWVVIHPLTGGYWVQGEAEVDAGNAWRVDVQFGEPGRHYGHQFEVQAFAFPGQKDLSIGKVGNWPRARWTSNRVKAKKSQARE